MTADWANLEIIDDPTDSDECSSDCSECSDYCYYCDCYLDEDEETYQDDEAIDRIYCKNCWLFINEK